jgi:hypothetical protein
MLDRDSMEKTRLRTLVGLVDRQMARFPEPVSTPRTPVAPGGPMEPWTELVQLLALGPEPEVRECPVCHHTGMRAARLCGHCWTKLQPLPATLG